MTDVAGFVQPGRCTCCGSLLGRWTPSEIVEAIREHHERTGRVPKVEQWAVATPTTPGARTVLDTFGTWNRAILAAGLQPRRRGEHFWTDEALIGAIREWARRHGGRPPRYRDWAVNGPGHPCARTIAKRFGSWNAGLDAAGFFSRGSQGVRYTAPDRTRRIAA